MFKFDPIMLNLFQTAKPVGVEEHGGEDWSLLRTAVANQIHLHGCLGWEEIPDLPGKHVHICRSRAGSVVNMLWQAGCISDEARAWNDAHWEQRAKEDKEKQCLKSLMKN